MFTRPTQVGGRLASVSLPCRAQRSRISLCLCKFGGKFITLVDFKWEGTLIVWLQVTYNYKYHSLSKDLPTYISQSLLLFQVVETMRFSANFLWLTLASASASSYDGAKVYRVRAGRQAAAVEKRLEGIVSDYWDKSNGNLDVV